MGTIYNRCLKSIKVGKFGILKLNSEKQNNFSDCQRWGIGEREKVVKKYKLPIVRELSSGSVIPMVTAVNSNVLYM